MQTLPKPSWWFAWTLEGPCLCEGYVVEGLVLHAHDEKTTPAHSAQWCWRISHERSGYILLPHLAYGEALGILERLLASPVRWREVHVHMTFEIKCLVQWYRDRPGD